MLEHHQHGFDVTASGYISSHDPYLALTSSTTSYFSNNGGWWQVQLDANLPISQIMIRTKSSTSSDTAYLTIQGSNDAVNFTQLGILQIPTSSSATDNTITIQYAPRYKYIRVYPSDATGASNSRTMTIYQFKITRWYSSTSYNKYTLSNYIPSLDKGQVAKLLVPSSYVGGNIQININSLGYKNVSIPPDVVIKPNKPLSLWYDGTNFQYEFSE